MSLIGHGVAVVTPFNKKGDIDYEALEKHVNNLIISQVDYLVVLGTTSEVSTLSVLEQIEISEFIVKINKNRLPLVIGVGGNDTSSVVHSFNKFNLSNFQSILSICPYYNLPNQRGLFKHFIEISKKCPIPVVIYNVPSRTGINIEPNTVFELLKKSSNIIGIKEASNLKNQMEELIKFSSNNFQIISGDDNTAIDSILAGASGVISVIGNAFPFQTNKLVKLALSNDVFKASKKRNELKRINTLISKLGNPAGIKCLISQLGICENILRLPLVPVSEEEFNKIKIELNTLSIN